MAGVEIKPTTNVKIKYITETNYRGMKSLWVEDKGWKLCFGAEEYLFRNWQDAKYAIDRIHEDCVKKYGGVKLKINK